MTSFAYNDTKIANIDNPTLKRRPQCGLRGIQH
jgi:hypothetical protein